MSELLRQLTIDEAVGKFYAQMQEQRGGAPPGEWAPPATREEADAQHFRLAEHLIGLTCANPAVCGDSRCRRDTLCRHLIHVRTKQATGKSSHPRRPPGADALRYAIWVYMSSRHAER